ncbi:hypothetical protein [Paenibacillus spongiae]|uniref:DUF58 domain-containing protein n=1 Tax=Paenibacillus spongiae TaxID=2909671 RepID=A0ABY5S3J6_9BACL|nr:hypothetical protein [Paenibacillus spongiae]UVI28264.1 hypothetical protein L1F29_22805 [Paenibacillus spongiae]
MTTIQSILGVLILLTGTFAGIAGGNFFVLITAVTCGLVLISLSKLLNYNREIHNKLLGLPLTKNQIFQIKKRSPLFRIESPWIDIYPQQGIAYPLLFLDDERYLRARVFYRYLSQDENLYTLELPGHEPVVLSCSKFYYKGVELFEDEEQVFVKISVLPVKLTFNNDRIIIDE